jgi:hypothetical protein
MWYGGWRALRAPSLSRFPGDIFGQKGREAVGNGHRNKGVPRCESARTSCIERAACRTRCSWYVRGQRRRLSLDAVAGDGPILARSESFTSCDDVERAARRVRDGAASARFDRRAGEFTPVDLGARRDGPNDDLDAERWLDEGGSFSSEAVLT